jgi:PAS domain S-box-containing protein
MNEHQRIEGKLKLLEFSIDSIPDAVYWITTDGRFWHCNAAACRMLGFSREELLSLSLHDIDPGYSREDCQSDLEELKRTGTLHLKRCHTTRDGRVIPVEITSNYLIHDDFEYICCIARDISERIRAEKEASFFRSLIEYTRDPVYVINHRDLARFYYINEAACLHFGREREELLTMGVPDVDPTIDMERLSELLEELRGKKALRRETINRRASGDTIPVEVTANYLELDGEELVSGYFHDISRRKSMEAALRQAHEELEKRVEERTADLLNANELLQHEITVRERAESVIMARLRLHQFAATHTLDELLEATLNEAEVLTGSLIGFYHFLEADQKTLSLQNWSTGTKAEFCKAEGKGRHYDVSTAGVWVDCIHERRPVVHNDYASLPQQKGLPPGHAPVVRELVVPVIRGNSIVAILGVGNKLSDYTSEDVEVVSFLADFAWDITESKRAEEALRKSRQMLMIVLDNFPGVVFWKDRNSVYLGCNRNFSVAAGLAEPPEIIGRSDYELPWKNDAESYLADDRQVIESGVPKLNIVETLLCADGRVAWFETSKVPLFDADGKVIAVLGVSNDITDRKRAEEAIRASEAEKSLILNSTMDYVMYHDPDMKIVWGNWKAAELTNLPMEELIGLHCWKAIHRRDEPCEDCPVVLARDTGQPQKMEKYSSNGLILNMRAYPIRSEDGRLLGIAEFVSDITERKRAEEALQKAHAELEIRVRERTEQLTSLTAELSLVEERERRRISTELHDQVGQTLIMSKIRLDSLSPGLPAEDFEASLADISKQIARSLEDIRSLTFQLSPPLLYEVGFEAAVEWLGEEFEEKYGFQVEFQDDGKTKPLNEETGVALYQMVRELLVNVAKHSKAEKARISVEKVSDKIRISVVDDGIGFDAMNGMGRKNKKRGFGLFNIRQRIEYIGGKLEVESRIGHGARVTLVLPLRKKKKSTNRRQP